MDRIRVLDSHTAGEPTRLVLDPLPGCPTDPVAAREWLRGPGRDLRRGLVLEPRGSEVWVGALLLPGDATHDHGLVFFNNEGVLGMCGHGLIGVVESLAYLGRLGEGDVRFRTPVGSVAARRTAGLVTFTNVPAYRHATDVALAVPGGTTLVGDIAWGGNWFFIVPVFAGEISVQTLPELLSLTQTAMAELARQGITGADGARIDHVELCTPSPTPGVNARNFVLCPGGAYDRSPCGTGTSAKLACLATAGHLAPGEIYRQESVTGGIFSGSVLAGPEGAWIPTITGQAWVSAESTLIFDPSDPLRAGFG
jgi:proline racemase